MTNSMLSDESRKQIQRDIRIYSTPWGGTGFIDACYGRLRIDIKYFNPDDVVLLIQEDERPFLLGLIEQKLKELCERK